MARRIFVAVALIAYLLDVASKVWAVEKLRGRPDIAVIGDWFTLHFTSNPGAAFSTGTAYTPVITCIAIIATFTVLWFGRRVASTGWAWALGLLLAGIVGNLTDRMLREPGPFRGEVVDMFRLPNWPVFNVADICINIAAGLIVIQAFRGMAVDGTRTHAESDAVAEEEPDQSPTDGPEEDEPQKAES